MSKVQIVSLLGVGNLKYIDIDMLIYLFINNKKYEIKYRHGYVIPYYNASLYIYYKYLVE